MRSYLITALMVLASLCSLACKDSSSSPEFVAAELTGTWLWTKSEGGFFGKTITPQSEGYTMTVVFTPTGMVEQWRSGVLAAQDRYTLVKETRAGREVTSVDYAATGYSPDQDVTFEGTNTLILTDRVMDGFTAYYTKLK